MTGTSEADFIDRPATIGDVMGWILAFQLVTLTFILMRIPSAIDHFRLMFAQLGGELPVVTQVVLGTPGFLWMLVPLLLTGSAIWVLVTSRNGKAKVVTASVAYVIELVLVGSAVTGIFYPILQLQSAVRGA